MKIFDADVTGSLHVSGSSNLQGGVSVTGSLNVSGDNKFGDQLSDNHNFTGSVNISGSATIIGNFTASQLHGTASYAVTSSYSLDSDKLDGNDSSAFATTGSNVFKGDQTITGSLTVTGSNTFIGTQTVTGALYTSGSNELVGNTTLSGSITISGSYPPTSPSASLKIYGNSEQTGYAKFLPVVTNLDTTISGSYIFVSGSTDDLYFSQNSAGYSNVTRLRWLEGNLYTGILKGGVLSSTPGSTTFNVSAGSGIIVTINASLTQDPYPTIKQVSWATQTNLPIINSGSAKITYVGIDNNGGIVQQTNAWGSTNIDQWDQQINLGVVLHLSGSVSTGVYNSQQTSYSQPQKADDFFRAFGPLKVSGHVLSPSGSAPTLSIIKSGGNSYKDGGNYVVNPNHPSTIIENGINTTKIYRYYISGSSPVIDTGVGGVGYTTIDNNQYVDTTTGTLTSVGNSNWTIQRVFWVPNSPTNAFIVYYGNAKYSTLLNAVNAKDSEPFIEAPNTALNAIFVGYIITEGGANGNLLDGGKTTIIQGGLFRSVGGIGSSGTPSVSTALSGLSDVELNSLSQGDLLMYNGGDWINTKRLPGNYIITGSLTTTQGFSGSLDYSYLINKPTLVSGSSQITYSGLTGIPSGIVSGSSQISSLGFITGYTETDTLDSVTDRGSVTTNTIEVGGLTSNGDIQFGPVSDSNTNYTVKSGGQIIIHSNDQGVADEYYSNLVLKAGFDDTQSVLNVGGSNTSTTNQGLWYSFGGSEYFRINPSGTVKLNQYTTNGFVKFINSDGTLSVDTNTYLTAHPSVSAASSSNNSGRTYIQDILLDSFGHITGITTATETVVDIHTTGVTFNTGNGELTFTRTDGNTYTVDLDGRYGTSSSDNYVTGGTFNTSTGNLRLTRNDGGTIDVDLDGRYLESHPAVSAASSSDNSGRTYIQDILLDSFGHITGITTATETVVDTYTTGGTTNSTTGLITFTKSDGNTYTASISGYVSTQIANLVDSAPTTLDTLNELAAALGDDPNFATTIATSIGNKVSKSGDTMTGNLTAPKFITSGGTSSQFVKGDGTLDSSTYLTSESDTLATVTARGSSTAIPVTFNSNVTLGNSADLVFKDLAGTFPTSGKGFDWELNNDGARIYAIQPSSDSIDLVFQLRDNATTNDRFVFHVDDYQGPAFDKYPLIIRGGTEFDLVNSSLYVDGTLVLSNGRVLQNVTGNISMFTNDSGYLTAHPSVSASSSSNNSGRTYIQDILLDSFGHITGITTASETVTDTFTTGATFNTGNGVITFTNNNGGGTFTVDIDGRFLTSYTEVDTLEDVVSRNGITTQPITAASFIVTGANSSQFLKGDGTLDSNTYLTAHPSVSAASSSNNSGRTYIQDILLDSFGHITGITTATETVVDTNNYTTGVTFNTGDGVLTFTRNDGNTYTVDLDGRYGSSSSDFYTTGATFNTSNGVITYTRNDGGTYTVDIDGRFLTSYSEISTLEDVVQRGNTSTISITASSFITQGGNSGEFVKGDGSLDTNTYLTAHPSVSAASSSNNSGRTYIQDILLDSFGHITGITTASETVTDTNYYVTGATFNTGDGIITLTRNDGNAITVDIDGRFLTAHPSVSAASSSNNSGRTYIQDILLDSFGHITGITTATETVVNTDTNYYVTGATFNTGNGIITLTRNDGGTVTVDIDGKYSELGHNHDDRYLPYVKNVETSGLASGQWYTIAVNSGNRASAKFILRDTSSGNHQSVVFYATHHFGTYSDITLLINSRYSGNPFRYIRIVDGGTYDGALLQVYIDQNSSTVQAWMLENVQNQGWVIKDWVDGGTDPGDVPNFPAMTEVPAQIDLDQAPQGGIITTGPVYGGGDTTQYEYLNTNNYSTTTDTRYYTETEIGNFFSGASSISGYNKSNWDTAYGWGNHATQGYATTGYVQTQITNLVDGAPGLLDTLNELAAAIGDDANFSTTIATSIGNKVSKSGDTMTGNLNFGATSNLGLTWGLNTDAAFIRFTSTGNGAGQSYLEIGTQDDSDEEIKFSQSGTVRFLLATDGYLKTGGGAKYVYESGTWGIDISGNAATVTNGVYTNGSYSNPSWITALAGSKITGNISGNAYNITQYTINQNLGTSNSPTFDNITATGIYSTNTSSSRNKYNVYGNSGTYAIGMESGVNFGGLGDWAMTFQFNNDDDRGFWWGDDNHNTSQGAMALTTNGYLTVARGVRVGYGESDTTAPSVPLQVYGSGSLVFDVQGSQGQLFSVTDSLSGSLFSVNDISGLPILEVFSDDRLVAGSYGTNAFVVSGTTTTVSGSLAVSGSATVNGGTVWHSGNDGSGSGLDADTLDGYHASSFLTGHPSVSAASSSNNSGRTYIQDILLDSYGHITGITTATETVTDTNDYISNVQLVGNSLEFTAVGSAFGGPIDLSSINTDTNYYVTSASFNTSNGVITLTRNDGGTVTVDIDGKYLDSSSYTASDVLSKLLTVDGSGSGLDADTLDGYHASSFLTSYSETDTLNSVTTRGASTTNDITIGGLTVGGSLSRGTYTSVSNYVTGADNIVLKGNSVGVSGIFFESEKDGTNINHPSDFGFIQYHAYGIGGSSGEANRLVIGVSNDADDIIVLNPVNTNGLVVRVGAGTTEYTVYHSGNIPTWNQNTSGNAATATYATTAGALSSMNISQFTNNSGYLTSESDTLSSVTARGASTSTTLSLAKVITTGLYGYGTSGNIAIWQYDATNTGYGIVYNEGSPDTLRFDVSGQALSGTPDFLVGPDYVQVNGNTVWHSGNDGSSSGLDADLLDGQHASYFINTSNIGSQSVSYASTAGSAGYSDEAKWINFPDGPRDLSDRNPNWNNRSVAWDFVGAGSANGSGNYGGVMTFSPWDGTSSSTGDSSYQLAFGNTTGVNASGQPKLSIRNGIDTTWNSWYTLLHSGNVGSYAWTSANDGSGSGLDADLLDGQHGSYYYPASNPNGYITSSGNAATATLASTVTINYNNDSNSTYQMLWGSGNSVYGTASVYVNPSTDYVYAGSFVSSGWFRSTGNTGWYSETHGGGIYMEDSTWVRVYNNKQFLSNNLIQSNTAMYAPIFYDSADNNYYLNPNGTSNLKTVKVNSTVAGTDALTVDGVNGRLFTITDDMTSSIFSVNTISGLPVMEAFADYTVVMGRYGQNDLYISNAGLIGIGKIPSTYKVDINGSVIVRGGYAYYGEYGTWTGEANKIQWHSNNLYIQNTGGGEFLFRNSGGSNVVSITNAGVLTASSLVKSGGSSSQFLMADGSVSTNPGWITSYTDTNYYVTGATFNTGNGIITMTRNDGGTITVDIDGKYQDAGTYLGAINYNNDSNASYQVLWGSGNAVYGTGGVYVNPYYDYMYATAFISTKFGIEDSGIDCYMEVGDGNPTEDGIGYGGTFHFYGDKSIGASHLYFGGAYVTYNFVVGGRITENSSIRYKKDIETLEGGLDKVLAMRGVTYVKKDTGIKEVGLIAEELAEILPEVVGFDTQGQPDSVSYSRLTAILVEAIKDLKKEIDELKGKK